MINVTERSAEGHPDDLAAVGVPVFATGDGPVLAGTPTAIDGVELPTVLDADWCERQGFAGKVAQVLVLRPLSSATGATTSPDVVLVGFGGADALSGDKGLESVRRSAAAFVRSAGKRGSALLLLPEVSGESADDAAASAAEGGSLAAYRYDEFRSTEPSPGLGTLVLGAVGADAGPVGDGAARGARVARSVAMARDLVNEPAGSLTPQRFADLVVDRFDGVPGVTVEVWDEGRIVEEHLGGLLGVAAGSEQPPRMVKVEYRPAAPYEFDGRTPHLALLNSTVHATTST